MESVAVTLVPGIVLCAESYCGAMDPNTDVPVKSEPGAHAEGEEEMLHTEIDLDEPELKEDYFVQYVENNRTTGPAKLFFISFLNFVKYLPNQRDFRHRLWKLNFVSIITTRKHYLHAQNKLLLLVRVTYLFVHNI